MYRGSLSPGLIDQLPDVRQIPAQCFSQHAQWLYPLHETLCAMLHLLQLTLRLICCAHRKQEVLPANKGVNVFDYKAKLLTNLQCVCESPACWSLSLCCWCFPPQKKNCSAAVLVCAAAAVPPAGRSELLQPEAEPAARARTNLMEDNQQLVNTSNCQRVIYINTVI